MRFGFLKAGFRLAHDILDKVAVAMNAYFGLGRDIEDVSFRNVFVDTSKGQNSQGRPPLLPGISERIGKNHTLRALLRVAEDWEHGRFPGPITRQRNAATHRILPLAQERDFGGEGSSDQEGASRFENRTYLVLRIARAAVLYGMAAIRHAEAEEGGENATSIPEFEIGVSVPVRR